MDSEKVWLKGASLVILALLMGELFIFVPTTTLAASSQAPSMNSNVDEIFPGQVVLIEVTCPNHPNDTAFIANNLHLYVGTTPVKVCPKQVYDLEEGDIYYIFLTATPTCAPKTLPVACGKSVKAGYCSAENYEATVISSTGTFYNEYLIYSSSVGNYIYDLPTTLYHLIYNNESKTVECVVPINLYTAEKSIITTCAKITATFSPPGVTPITISLENLLDSSNSYSPTLQLCPNAAHFYKEVGYLPFNSTIPVIFTDQVYQADPFQSCTFINATTGKCAYVNQKVCYPSILSGEYVSTKIFTNEEYAYSDQVYGVPVYNGTFIMNTTVVATYQCKNYEACLTSGHYTPAYVTGAQFKYDTVGTQEVKPDTPVKITFEDAFEYTTCLQNVTSFSLINVQSFSLSISSQGTLTVDAPDNVTNLGVSGAINVVVALVCKTSGLVVTTGSADIPEVAAGCPYFTAKVEVKYSATPKITFYSCYDLIVVCVTPSQYSTTELRINATNDIGASYYIESSEIPVNSSGIGTITVQTSTLSDYSPSVQQVSNTTDTYTFVWNEPNLAFGVPTTLTMSGYNVEYNGIVIANANVTVILPNGKICHFCLSKLGITSLTSPTGNGTFFITVLKTELENALGLKYIPAGTKITLNIYDDIVLQQLSATYELQVIVPTIYLCAPTSHGFSSVTAYIPNLEGSSYKHYINIEVHDQAYASQSPTSVLTAAPELIVENSSGIKLYSITMTLTETASDSGYFNGTFTYYINNNGYLVINGVPTTVKACKLIDGMFVVEYTSPATDQVVNGTITLTIAQVTLSTNTTTAMSGQPVAVTLNAPGLKPAPNYMNMKLSPIPFTAMALLWNGYSTTLTNVMEMAYLVQVSSNSTMFTGTVYLGNQVITNSTSEGITNLAANGYTVAPQTTVYFNFTNQISRFSTSSGIVSSYHQVSVGVNDINSTFNLGIYNVHIVNIPPAGPFEKLEIQISSPLFQYLEHPAPGSFSLTSNNYENIVGEALSILQAQVSGQTLTSTDIMAIASTVTANYSVSPVPTYTIYVPMALWDGLPNSYTKGSLNVNLTDNVVLSGNLLAFHEITVPVPSEPGITAISSGYATLSIKPNISSIPIGIMQPIISLMYNGENVTENPALALPFVNTSTGILVTVSVYSPSTATEFTSFTVNVYNPATGVKTTLTLAEQVISGVYTGNYTGELRIVPVQYYSFYAGQPGVVSVAPGTVNNISTTASAIIGAGFVNGVYHSFTVSASSYFFVGKIVLKPVVTGFTAIYTTTGKPVSLSDLTAGQTYELFFNLTNEGTVTTTVYAVVEITVNTTTVLQPEIFVESITPGQTVTFGPEWTPAMPGMYNITILLFSNPQLTIPYVPGKYVYTATVSS
ncbi:S-layer protein SlaA [Acidianus sp. HS-5]|uniref:S-layer protein SlaA n=1 Tax=Acidianus sp. HS-5 TaxID=2886040 RepID=UPI001F1EA7BF|nr:S-layer protein SlaA [Acidianus sp. HS-5]BDC19521.1 hypothetical protein HS5_24110 [Acidianus sp. HS-5]